MIETKDLNRSLLIPKWLSIRTSLIEDFKYSQREPIINASKDIDRLKDDYTNFQAEPTITYAAELLHASIVLNEQDIAHRVAKYIVKKSSIEEPLLKLAKEVIDANEGTVTELPTNSQIAKAKIQLNRYPRDPLLWTDIARLYTIKGQLVKAQRAINVAVSLAPDNRFVMRAASRFFIHINIPDVAVQLLKKAHQTNSDPMILATLTNCSIIAGKKPKMFRKSTLDLISDRDLYQFSELLSTAAILEMRSGSNKKAKQLYRKGWLEPTENVIAHAEWVIRNRYPGIKFSDSLDFDRSAEATTWRKYYMLQLSEAIEMALKWSLEEPYSTHPFTCGSSIACDAGKDKIAVKFARSGLKANPNDMMLRNNLAYALLKLNRLKESEKLLHSLPDTVTDVYTAFVAATKGYSYFKRGLFDLGRQLYLTAIRKLADEHRVKLVAKAMLCHAYAEQEARTKIRDDVTLEALRVSKTFTDPSITLLRATLSDIKTKG